MSLRQVCDRLKEDGIIITQYKLRKAINIHNLSLANKSGVFLFVNNGKVTYIGQSIDLGRKLESLNYGYGLEVLYIEAPPSKLNYIRTSLINKLKPHYKKEATSTTLDSVGTIF